MQFHIWCNCATLKCKHCPIPALSHAWWGNFPRRFAVGHEGLGCLTLSMSESGASRGEQASWEPINSAPWIRSFTPTLRRPRRSMVDRGTSSSALMGYQPSVSHTTVAGDSGFASAVSLASSGLTELRSHLAIPHTQSARVFAGVSSLSVIFFKADLRLWSTSTSYLKIINGPRYTTNIYQ